MPNAAISVLWITLLVTILSGCSRIKHLDVSGHLQGNNHWTIDKSPYLLSGGDVYLDAGAQLKIDPGVMVHLIGNNYFIIEGQLDAQGTSNQPIIFKPLNLQIGNIRGLKFVGKNPPSRSILKYIQVQDANFGIYVDGANLQLSYSLISACGEGLHLWNTTAIIENNIITNNKTVGVYIGGGQPRVIHNQISNNETALVLDYNTRPTFSQNNIYLSHSILARVTKCISPINLTNNWWGINDYEKIKSGFLVEQDNGPNFSLYINPLSQKPF